MSDESVTAVVEKIVASGKHGAYAVARYEDKATGKVTKITFSLKKKGVWKERGRPELGSMVVLSELVRKPNGWKAEKARYFTLRDEQQQKGAVSR